jgi:hypothetical protein
VANAQDGKGDAERSARNEGLKQDDQRLQDPAQRSPHTAAKQGPPEPERPITPQEDAEQDLARLENPPQTEGPRERNNDAV